MAALVEPSETAARINLKKTSNNKTGNNDVKKGIAVVMGALAISGCKLVDSDEAGSSPLVGTWETNACAQMEGPEGAPIELWAKGLWSFYRSGALALRLDQYADPACTSPKRLVEDFEEPAQTPFSYVDFGEETLGDGLRGGRVLIMMDYDGTSFDAEGFYTINAGLLCFSHNLNFEPLGFLSSEAESTDIDFEKCLTKID